MFNACPEGWFFGEIKVTDENDQPVMKFYNGKTLIQETVIVAACSEKCALSFWRKGPGKVHPHTGDIASDPSGFTR